MPEIKRQTAYKCTIKQILTGNYVQKTGWDPNYIEIGKTQISRVNIIATIVTKEENTLFVDDGTGQMSIMLFNESINPKKINVGDVAIIIGKPREYNNQRYVVPEIIKKIENKKWIDYRKKELALQDEFEEATNQRPKEEINESQDTQQDIDEPEQDSQEEQPVDNYAYQLINLIKKLDAGSGAEMNEVISQSKIKDAEKYLTTLMNEGEIFEIRPGKLKVLE